MYLFLRLVHNLKSNYLFVHNLTLIHFLRLVHNLKSSKLFVGNLMLTQK